MSKVQIELPDGNEIEIDGELLKGYKEEAFEILSAEAKAKADFKNAVELQAEGLGISKKYLTKYLKVAFKQQQKETSAVAEMIAKMDEATQTSDSE
jgi:hypothetical protein